MHRMLHVPTLFLCFSPTCSTHTLMLLPSLPYAPPTLSTLLPTLPHTHMQHLSSNHRAHDRVIVESSPMPTIVTAKFQYGPLDMASLSKELVSLR